MFIGKKLDKIGMVDHFKCDRCGNIEGEEEFDFAAAERNKEDLCRKCLAEGKEAKYHGN